LSGGMEERPLACVTGGARRVGRAIALELARRGCDLVVTFRDSGDEAASLVTEAGSLGAHVRLDRVDLADVEAVEDYGAMLASEERGVDVLVHNASIYRATPLDTLSSDDALEMYRVNALAPLMLTQRLAETLGRSEMNGGGAVVAMADIHAMGLPRSSFAAYAMSKSALVEMVRSLARELAPRVRVNGVAPGVVAWPEGGYESDPGAQAAYLKRVPLARAGTPEEAAGVVGWLALEATYMTGQVVRIDGGRSLL
jgi:pteridine reductase